MFSFGPMVWVGFALTSLAVGLAFGDLALLTGAIFLLLMVLLASYPLPPYGVSVERRLTRAICWAGDSMEVGWVSGRASPWPPSFGETAHTS